MTPLSLTILKPGLRKTTFSSVISVHHQYQFSVIVKSSFLNSHYNINISMNNKFTQNNFRKTSIVLCWEKREKWHARACCIFYDSLLSVLFFLHFQSPVFSSSFTVFSPHRNALNTPLLVSHWLTADERKKGTPQLERRKEIHANTIPQVLTKKEDSIMTVQPKNGCTTSETNHNSPMLIRKELRLSLSTTSLIFLGLIQGTCCSAFVYNDSMF